MGVSWQSKQASPLRNKLNGCLGRNSVVDRRMDGLSDAVSFDRVLRHT